MLSREQHAVNMAGIREQMERLLDFDPGRGYSQALLVDNADWLVNYRLVDFLRDIGKHFTVNQMVAKESVRSRIERPEQGISFTEFSYMLLQACDYLHLYDEYGCRLQFGGSDQWGNITMGVELIRKVRQAEAHAFTWPLLLSAEGRKYGKSAGNAIWLDARRTPVFAFYQHFLRAPDDEVGALLRFLTFLGHDEIVALDEATALHPERRAAQRALAQAVTSFVHGPDEAARAERATSALYSEDIAALDEETLLTVLADAPTLVLARARLGGPGAACAPEGRATGHDGAQAGHGGPAETAETAEACHSWTPSSRAALSPRGAPPAGRSNRGAPTSTTPAAPRRRPGSRGPTCCTTASYCYGGGGGTTASCVSSEAEQVQRGGSPACHRSARHVRLGMLDLLGQLDRESAGMGHAERLHRRYQHGAE